MRILLIAVVLGLASVSYGKAAIGIKNKGDEQVIEWAESDHIVKEDLIVSQELKHRLTRDANGPTPDENPVSTNTVMVSALTRSSAKLKTLWKKTLNGPKAQLYSPAGYQSGKFDLLVIPNEDRYWESAKFFQLTSGELLFESTVMPANGIQSGQSAFSYPISRFLGVSHLLYEVQDPTGMLVRIADVALATANKLLDRVQLQGPMVMDKAPSKTIAESVPNRRLKVHFEAKDASTPIQMVADAILTGAATPYLAVVTYGGKGQEPAVVIRIPVVKDKFDIERASVPAGYSLKRIAAKESFHGKSIIIQP